MDHAIGRATRDNTITRARDALLTIHAVYGRILVAVYALFGVNLPLERGYKSYDLAK